MPPAAPNKPETWALRLWCVAAVVVNLPRRMRACLAILLGLSLGLPPVAMAAPSSRSMPAMWAGPEAQKPPEVLYEEGKKAYRLGNFDVAVQKWEKAYDLSEQSLLLYNISLAYKGRYGLSGDVEDLRKARAVMNNFLIIAKADPEIDPDDAVERIAELDQMIADFEANRPPPPPDDPKPKEEDDPKPMGPEGPDPGRTLRIAGAASLGAGGLLVVSGAVLGIFYGVRGQEFSDELRQLQAERDSMCADPDSTICMQQDANIDTARNNGRKANLGLGLALGIGGGLGLVALGAGAILFVQGNRKTAAWRQTGFARRQLRVVPTGRGLAVSGRF